MNETAPPEGKAWEWSTPFVVFEEITGRRRLQPYSVSELDNLPRREYLVKGLLDRAAMSVLYGGSNSGKTFFALDIGLHVALGWPWRGLKVRHGAVLYIAAEGGLGLRERLAAFKMHHEIELVQAHFWTLPTAVNLCGPQDDAAEIIGEVALLPQVPPLALVVVDTLSRTMAGGNENSPEDMTAFVGACDAIRRKTGAHVLVIHHSGKDEGRGSRGHSSLKAATDTETEVTKDETSGIATATVRKQRDAISGTSYSFKLRQIDVGQDEDGDTMTSCVVVPQDTPGRSRAAPKLTPKQKQAFNLLKDCLADGGQRAPDDKHYPAGRPVVSLDLWRNYLLKAGVLDKDGANPREAYRRLRRQLRDKGLIAEWNNFLWNASA